MKGKLRTAGWSIVFLALSFLSLSWGTVEITPGEALVYTWQAVLGVESGSISSDVVQYLRLPHFVLAFAVGWGLALCGTVMQAVMRNPLADPYLLGISSGAGLGAVIAMALGADAYLGMHGVSMCAFLGAVGISLVILFVASAAGKGDSLTLLLVGFAMNALCFAALSFIIQAMADTHKTKSVQFWLMGNIMADSWTDIGILAGIIAAGSIFFMGQRRILDLMLIGDELSLSMGRNLAVYRKIYILVVAVLVGSIVYVAGMVGFIGLIIPHMVRMAAGSGHKSLIPLAGLAGGCFLAWCCRRGFAAERTHTLPDKILKRLRLAVSVLRDALFVFGDNAFYRVLYRRRVGHQRKSVFSDIFRRVGVFGHYFCKDFFRRAAVYLP